jgi:O-antigen ligase
MVFLAVGMLCAGLIFLDVGTALDNFFNSKAGSKLLELNGREVIWQYALREWFANPFFGYGPLFLDLKQRLLIGLINATHAHSQFIDLLARSGVIGLLSVIPYLLIMMSMAFKANLALRGLAVSLFLVIFIKCISEVPLTLYGYSLELLMQLTLLAILLLSNNKIASAPTDVNIGSLQEAIR